MVQKRRNSNPKNIFLSDIAFATRVSLDILVQVHNMVFKFCSTYGLYYIDNRNIRAEYLYKDGLHHLDKGKIVFANNFTINFLAKQHKYTIHQMLDQIHQIKGY